MMITVILMLCMAFAEATFDVRAWNKVTRGLLAFSLGLMWGFVLTDVVIGIKNDRDDRTGNT